MNCIASLLLERLYLDTPPLTVDAEQRLRIDNRQTESLRSKSESAPDRST